MSRSWGPLETVFTVFLLFWATTPVFSLLRFPVRQRWPNPVQGDLATQLVWAACFATILGLLCLRWQVSLRAALVDPWILGLIALALASTLWSIEPTITLRRAVALALTTAAGVYLGSRYSSSRMVRLLCWSLGLAALLSFLFGWLLPQWGVNDFREPGTLRGIYRTKNLLGRYMLLGAMVFQFAVAGIGRSRFRALFGFALCTTLLMLSWNLAAIAGLVVLLPALFWIQRRRPHVRVLASVTLGLIAILALMGTSESLFGLLGKPFPSSRALLWPQVQTAIEERPLLGYGLDAYWLTEVDALPAGARDARTVRNWRPSSAHNGLLELLLDLGIVGLVLVAPSLWETTRRAIARMRRGGWQSLWPLALLLYLFALNLTESALVNRNSLFWMLYVATTVQLGLEERTGPSTRGQVVDRGHAAGGPPPGPEVEGGGPRPRSL